MTWIPQSDDQFFYWDWSIRNGVPMTLGYEKRPDDAARITTINGFPPASAELHRIVNNLKGATMTTEPDPIDKAMDSLEALTAPLAGLHEAMAGLGPDSSEEEVDAALAKMNEIMGTIDAAGAAAVADIREAMDGGVPASPDEKYIVFTREEFFQLMGRLALPNPETFLWDAHTDCAPIAMKVAHHAESACLTDAVVIRTKDVFAGPALHAYWSAINLVIEGMVKVYGEPNEASSAATIMKGLRSAADYLHERAVEADEIAHAGNAKFPG